MLGLAGCGAAAAAPMAHADVLTLYRTNAFDHGRRTQAATFDTAGFDTAEQNKTFNDASCQLAAELFSKNSRAKGWDTIFWCEPGRFRPVAAQ